MLCMMHNKPEELKFWFCKLPVIFIRFQELREGILRRRISIRGFAGIVILPHTPKGEFLHDNCFDRACLMRNIHSKDSLHCFESIRLAIPWLCPVASLWKAIESTCEKFVQKAAESTKNRLLSFRKLISFGQIRSASVFRDAKKQFYRK